MKNRTILYLLILFCIAFAFLLCFYPTQIPRPWFDEGWTLATARNWVENGQYARLLNDEPISATGMAWNFPVTAPIALSFRLFGFGVWQGRLPSTLFTIASTFLIFLLTRKFYGEKTALIAITLIVFGFPFSLLYGRQAIGEPAMLFYLLVGYYSFGRYLENRSRLSLALSVIFWGAALVSKNQALPFWAFSVLVVILFAGIKRNRFIFFATIGVFLGTLVSWQGMLIIQDLLEVGLPLYGAPMKGLLEVTGWVPVWRLRLKALELIAIFALPLLFGLGYVLFAEIPVWKLKEEREPLSYLRLAYWVLVSSWVFWFASLAMPWTRYLYPSTFLGSVFIASLIYKLTSGLNFSQAIQFTGAMLRERRFSFEGFASILGVVVLSYISIVVTWNFIYTPPNNSTEEIAAYLNRSTPTDAYIETYDSELLFLVERRFHYPPDQIQVELNKRIYRNPSTEIQYDPMPAKPDYIIIGPYGTMWKLYDQIVTQEDHWGLIYEIPNYKVYQRIP